MSKAVLIVAAIWTASALYATGTCNANFQANYSHGRSDLGFCAGLGLSLGPAAAFSAFFLSGFNEHGWSLRV